MANINKVSVDGTVYDIEDTIVRASLNKWNLNQRVKVNPFVLSQSSTSLGEVVANRSSFNISNTSIKVIRSSSSPSTASYGLWFRPIKSNESLLNHKVFVCINSLDWSGNTSSIDNVRLMSDGTTLIDISLPSGATELTYENIFTMSNACNTFTLLLRTSASQGEYFTVDYMQFIDLTEMFGSGNEPTLDVFKQYYNAFPYSFDVSSPTVSLSSVNVLIDNKMPLDIVNNVSDIEKTTKDYVLVTQSTYRYSNGPLWYYKRAGETSSDAGYTRDSGDVVYPMPNQGTLKKANAPKQKILDVIKSYVGLNSLTYGNDHGLYASSCTSEIDCSDFVTAVLYGTKYNMSRYSLGSSVLNVLGEYTSSDLMTTEYSQWSKLTTRAMASYFASNKRLFTLPNSALKACQMLQFGDLLFSRDESHDDSYFKIGHVAVVIGTIPQYSTVIVAEAGASPNAYTAKSNESTVVKTSQITLNNTALSNHYFVFARPDYSENYVSDIGILSYIGNNGVKIKASNTFFQLNTIIDGDTGRIAISSGDYASSVDYVKVNPSSNVTYTGNTSDSNSKAYTLYVAQYDANKNFLSRVSLSTTATTLNQSTEFVRFTIGHGQSQNTRMTLHDLDDFEAVID